MPNIYRKDEYPLNVLSIDVEEWYQTILFNRMVHNNAEISDLPKNIYEILLLLEEYNTKATFFIVGSVAKKYPEIVKMIVQKGHEVASHGYLHRLIYKISKQEFIDDVSLSLDVLRRAAETEIMGYRAPTWSITKNTYWAIDVLKSLGFKYDSSIYPLSFNLLKTIKLKKFPYRIRDNFIEFPPSVFQFLGYNIPFVGGTFLRLFPFDFIKNKITKINKRGYPAMVYFHSWEFDDGAPKLNIPKWKYSIQYGNFKTVRAKLKLLLQNFKFTTIKHILRFK